MAQSIQLKDKLASLPDSPGVYLFKDAKDRIIYVGKAKSLRSRVRSYFSTPDDGRYQYPKLVTAIRDLEIILTRDEVEALATEAAIIRREQPRFNVDLRDDKSFPFMKITQEEFPRISLTRKPRTAKADYYGPYTNVKNARYIIRNLKGILQIRDCNLELSEKKIDQGKFKLCLDYHIGRCGGPCEGKVSLSEYNKGVDNFRRILLGHHDEIIEELIEEMKRHSQEMEYEKAAVLRDRIQGAQRFFEKQTRVAPKAVNRDVIGLEREDSYAAFSVLKIRNGRIVGQSPFHMERAANLNRGELLEAFIVRHYDQVESFPDEIILPDQVPDQENLTEYLHRLAERSIKLSVPLRGDKRKQLETAATNARHLMLERRLMAEKRDFVPRSAKALQDILHLPNPPLLIECFDISNLHGTDSVASMVVFKDGKPYKAGYRIFRIKQVEGIDDFASIAEAVRRRYSRILSEMNSENNTKVEKQSEEPRLPDLILIDGGKGQLSSAKKALDELGLQEQPIIGLAKRLEEIVIPGTSSMLTLPRTSSALRLLQQLRDEAHRFAVSKHRMLRHKRHIKSKLDDVTGIGKARKAALLKQFGSLKRIAEADVDDIAETGKFSKKLAEEIKDKLTSK
ncbi:excinuclease ABC subunit UvrC [Calditrichota bacterium]